MSLNAILICVNSSSHYQKTGTNMFIIFLILISLIESASQTKCLEECSCKWRSGKMTVECLGVGFYAIPNGLNSDTQVLHLTGNPLKVLRAREFQLKALTHLQRIYLNRCELVSIDNHAFYQVSNLVELDLSHNLLTSVPTKALVHCPIIRKLNLAHNPIGVLDNNSFAMLVHLQTIDVSNANISSINANAFNGLNSLNQLYLNGNKLRHLSGNCVQSLPSLYELVLHNNPWNCDCGLKDLREWMLQHKIPLSYPPNCTTPARLAGRDWSSLELEEFACTPSIMSEENNVMVNKETVNLNAYIGDNASLDCVMRAIPSVNFEWQRNGREIRNMSVMTFGKQIYIIRDQTLSLFEWSSTLYILNVFAKDSGSYTCIGSNKAGSVMANLTLTVLQRPTVSDGIFGDEVMSVSGIVIVTITVLLLILIVVISL